MNIWRTLLFSIINPNPYYYIIYYYYLIVIMPRFKLIHGWKKHGSWLDKSNASSYYECCKNHMLRPTSPSLQWLSSCSRSDLFIHLLTVHTGYHNQSIWVFFFFVFITSWMISQPHPVINSCSGNKNRKEIGPFYRGSVSTSTMQTNSVRSTETKLVFTARFTITCKY